MQHFLNFFFCMKLFFLTLGSVPLFFFTLEFLFEYNENVLYRMKPERKFLVCLSLLLNLSGERPRKNVFQISSVFILLEANCQTCVKRSLYRSLKSAHFGQMVFCKTHVRDYFRWFYQEKCFFIFLNPYTE